MYQHDIELIERFARENPDVIDRAREKLMVCTVMYRCENFHIYFPGKWLGETIPCQVCGGMMRMEAQVKNIKMKLIFRKLMPPIKFGGWPAGIA